MEFSECGLGGREHFSSEMGCGPRVSGNTGPMDATTGFCGYHSQLQEVEIKSSGASRHSPSSLQTGRTLALGPHQDRTALVSEQGRCPLPTLPEAAENDYPGIQGETRDSHQAGEESASDNLLTMDEAVTETEVKPLSWEKSGMKQGLEIAVEERGEERDLGSRKGIRTPARVQRPGAKGKAKKLSPKESAAGGTLAFPPKEPTRHPPVWSHHRETPRAKVAAPGGDSHLHTGECAISPEAAQDARALPPSADSLPEEGSTNLEVEGDASAKDKVALLIGNMNYWEHPKLKVPLVDVYELTIRQLDFKVVSLLDLTEYEMRNDVDEFLLLLDKGVYGLLYYAGHGYENFENSFMVPVDAPNPYRSENCLCVQNILKLKQEKETGLNVFLLDMCRKRNDYDDTIPILDALKVTANIVFGYAMCQGAEAFEIQHSGLANGIFMKFLKDRLLEDKKITVLLDEVAEDMGKCHLTKGKQALEIQSSLSEKRALTDPIQEFRAQHSAESLVRNLQWAKAHELPESMCLKFQCGVQIQLGFAAEFSNVMIIYTSIVHKPPEIIMCDANVTDFPLDLDIDPKDANKGTPEETGSYLVSKDLPKHCLYPRLSSLQKLKEHLIFTVCLSYQYSGLEDTVEEKQEVNFGKPLIAKLDMHRSLGRKTCLPTRLILMGTPKLLEQTKRGGPRLPAAAVAAVAQRAARPPEAGRAAPLLGRLQMVPQHGAELRAGVGGREGGREGGEDSAEQPIGAQPIS
ncbi:LOW QUALITY PROTEIN: mucosa-associated lymphoid tissue lymphoma translocation protein 1-like [Callospermophilus lateralis]